MQRYVVCNWKMNPGSFDKARALLAGYNKIARIKYRKDGGAIPQLVVCPPFLYFQLFDEKRVKSIKLGAQNIFFRDGEGSYTGQISARMVREFGAEYVLIGHPDVRRLGENIKGMLLKINYALKRGIRPIILLGHTDYARETKTIIHSFSADEINKCIFAYEPSDAVGTGEPADTQKVARVIRDMKRLIYKRFKQKHFLGLVKIGGDKYLVPRPPILYGGSVNAKNCATYLQEAGADGFVIGGESLKPEEVQKIMGVVANH